MSGPARPRASRFPLLSRCWELRENLTIHDAAYIAPAEALQVDFLTGDSRMAKVPGPRGNVEARALSGAVHAIQAVCPGSAGRIEF